MVAAQAVRSNPVTRAFRQGTGLVPQKIGYTVAEGLACGDPGRKGEWVLRLLRELHGLAGDAEDEEILDAQQLLVKTEGIWAGPTGVAALAVLRRLLADKVVDPDALICVILSETGLKTESVPPRRDAVAFDEASLRRLVGERLGRPSA
jgi:threonine synthase